MSNKSFTIVEIMVVMAVIGIIMTLSIVGIQAAQKQQRVTTITNDMNQLKLALASFYSEYRKYPVPGTEFILAADSTGICLYEPTVPQRQPVEYPNCDDTSGRVANIKLSQPGMVAWASPYENPYRPCSPEEETNPIYGFGSILKLNMVIPSPEQWVLDYRYQEASRPQAYRLRFCTEAGGTEFLSQ